MTREAWKKQRKPYEYYYSILTSSEKSIAVKYIEYIEDISISIDRYTGKVQSNIKIHLTSGTMTNFTLNIERKYHATKLFGISRNVPYKHQDYFNDPESMKQTEENYGTIYKAWLSYLRDIK